MTYLTRTIWILSVVSLLNDISSEILYPVMPLFLSSIGFSSVLIGVLEGFAEATAGLSKGYFGRWSDSMGRRLPFVNIGYLLSAFSKPMMAAFTHPLWIFSARATDRLGKGIRTAARDAILSDESTPENKGKVFGFHKGMDTLGATIGPLLALVFLYYYPAHYTWIFMIAFVPALLGTLLTFFVKEKKLPRSEKPSFKLSQTFDYLTTAPADYKKVAGALLLFALFNSSDLFLLMKIKESGLSDYHVIGCYILYNLVFALAAFPLGHLADKFGMKKTMLLGLVFFVLVYAGFGINHSLTGFVILFVLYGIYAASTDGISKALISNMVPKTETASAIGTFAGLNSIAVLLASTLAGVIWKFVSPEAVFLISAMGAAIAAVGLYSIRIKEKHV
ncbi:MAG TPA: MFS transporter [Chitinophagales bacterium]|nr:MFS transporter [Chitinophagales bacterium]